MAAWISKRSIRREDYKHLFESMKEMEENAEETEETTSCAESARLPFMKASTTRWLVRGKLIQNMINNWNCLRAYFTVVEISAGQDSRCKARYIKEMFHDNFNYLYFVFLNPIVKDFEMVNVFFQATSTDPEEMTKELDILHRSLRHRIKDKFGASVSLNMADYGAQFLGQMETVRRAYSTRSELFQTRSTEVKMRCFKFMENLLLEVENCLPSSTAVFRGLSGLSPSKILSQAARLPFDELPSQHLMGDSKDEIQNQYKKIILNIWRDEPIFGSELPKDSATF